MIPVVFGPPYEGKTLHFDNNKTTDHDTGILKSVKNRENLLPFIYKQMKANTNT